MFGRPWIVRLEATNKLWGPTDHLLEQFHQRVPEVSGYGLLSSWLGCKTSTVVPILKTWHRKYFVRCLWPNSTKINWKLNSKEVSCTLESPFVGLSKVLESISPWRGEYKLPVFVIGHWNKNLMMSYWLCLINWTTSGGRKFLFFSKNPSAWYTTRPAKWWTAKQIASDFGRT